MKKLFYILGLFISVMMLQSCNIDSEVIYHKDKAVSVRMGFDFKQLIDQIDEMKANNPDNKAEEKQEENKLDKIPLEWTSFYEMEKQEGKKLPTSPDSIRMYKKMFVKRKVKEGKSVGMDFKMEHFTKEDIARFNKNRAGRKKGNSILSTNNIERWDGKKLVINTKELNFDGLEDLGTMMKDEGDEENNEKTDEGKVLNQMSEFLKMIKMNYVQTLRFESKIKSIKGKHDWVKQVDDHTIQVSFSTEKMNDGTVLQYKDDEIIVEVE